MEGDHSFRPGTTLDDVLALYVKRCFGSVAMPTFWRLWLGPMT